MSYRNAIPDISPGSLWRGPMGAVAVVASAAARHVSWRWSATGQPVVIVPAAFPAGFCFDERTFRTHFAPLYDREKVRSQFTMSLANLGEFRVFWLPDLGRIMVRSVSCQRQFRVPDGALIVGTYSAPCKAEDFFEALEAVILAPTQAKARAAK